LIADIQIIKTSVGCNRKWRKKMNESYDRIFAEYRDADFNRRLHMYLQLREQRSDFNAIDQNEQNHAFSGGSELSRNGSAAQLSVIFAAAMGLVKKLLA
jgi:hypothetical protein